MIIDSGGVVDRTVEQQKTPAIRELLVDKLNDLQSQLRAVHTSISELQEDIRATKRALSAIEKSEIRSSQAKQKVLPYAGMRTWKAIRIYLEKKGELRSLKDVTRAMLDGGAMYGKREWRAERNVRIAVSMAQDLEFVGDKIGLSEWFQKGGKYADMKPEPKDR